MKKTFLFVIGILMSGSLLAAPYSMAASEIGASAKTIGRGYIEGYEQRAHSVFENPATMTAINKGSIGVFSARLMNEVTYVEAAKKFAERMMTKGGTPEERIAWGFRCATSRVADGEELDILVKGYERRVEHYRKNGKAAEDLLGQGESKVPGYLPKPEMAALTTVANVILNLDEVINK